MFEDKEEKIEEISPVLCLLSAAGFILLCLVGFVLIVVGLSL